jgi:hypothetical protein
VLTVIAGRNPPAAAWRTDPGWNALLRVLPLRNFDSEESETYLQRRAVPPGQHAAAIKFSHGHPLALSLIADLLIQGDTDALARGLDDPDLIRVLLDRFVQGVPDQLHRRALQLCAHIRVTTEALLAEVISPKRAGELFQWLRDLSFIEQGPSGLFPHDLARDVLEGDLRWRNPEAYREDHRRIRNAIVRTLQSTHGPAQQRAFFDLLFLHRHNPLIKPYVEWAALGTIYAEPAGPVDHPAIVELVRHHEGDASAGIAGFWLERQPQAFTVFRGEGDSVTGFIASLVLAEITPEICAADPAMPAAQTYVERYGPLRSGEVMLHHRFAMGRDAYQNASPVWNMVIMTSNLQWFSTLRLAWSLLLVADPDYWRPTLSYINLRRADEADFTVGDRRYSVFAHDWRAEPPIAWLDLMAERELNTTLTLRDVEAPSPPPVIVLSEPQFRQAVRQALRDFSRPDRLARNPLVQAALVRERPDGSDGVPALRAVLREAAATLTQNPKDRRLYRAIERGCFAPASTQELAAEALGLPFSTYRSHLTTAIQRITDWLWERELDIANHSGT